MRARRNYFAGLGVAALVVAACGGSGDSSSDTVEPPTASSTTTVPTVTEPPPTDTTPPTEATDPTAPPDGGIDSFNEVQPAVVQIVAKGSFRDPEVGMVTSAGSGSGFVIDEDGLAVTNNHVVTGAATLEVFIGGDTNESYNARVIGASECNDLALIEIISEEPLPHLEWADEAPSVGTEIYAAGFPLGDPEFTLTRGIVAKAQAAGDTQWASIDAIIEHDANTQPGNSGGPLVGDDGRVIGVHYAGGSRTNTAQFFAIEGTLAQRVIDQLHDGDFESLGINGTAVFDEESGISGVWVAGTAPGSPASDAGILPGDIVTSLNGLPIAMDGTMKDYCDVIRTAGDRPISAEILRYDTQEVLSGEINGEIPLAQVFSFAEEIEDGSGPVDEGSGATYSAYQTLVDDTGQMTVDVPVDWFDVDTVPFEDGTLWISASTSLDTLYSGSFDVPGMIMIGSAPIPPENIPATIAEYAPGGCLTDDGLADYDDGYFVGQYQLWADCGNAGAVEVVIVANANSGVGAVLIGVQIVTDADFEALDTIIGSFDIVSD